MCVCVCLSVYVYVKEQNSIFSNLIYAIEFKNVKSRSYDIAVSCLHVYCPANIPIVGLGHHVWCRILHLDFTFSLQSFILLDLRIS